MWIEVHTYINPNWRTYYFTFAYMVLYQFRICKLFDLDYFFFFFTILISDVILTYWYVRHPNSKILLIKHFVLMLGSITHISKDAT